MKKNKIEVHTGFGKLIGKGKVEVDNNGKKSILDAKHILLAKGARERELPHLKIEKKKVINNYALSKTKISIFYADTLNKGLDSFVELNDTQLIIRELNDNLNLRDLNLNFTPTLLIMHQ